MEILPDQEIQQTDLHELIRVALDLPQKRTCWLMLFQIGVWPKSREED
jgi:hypothetical protein